MGISSEEGFSTSISKAKDISIISCPGAEGHYLDVGVWTNSVVSY